MAEKREERKRPAAGAGPAGRQDAGNGGDAFVIRRHWFGLSVLYGLILLGILVFLVLAMTVSDPQNDDLALAGLVVLAVAVLLAVPLSFFIWKVYWGNVIRIGDTEVRQLARQALFHTKTSTLGLANIEDVTVIRNGFFAHLLNFGTLNIETAGEQENFTFRYCPKPEECMRTLMKTREEYLKKINQDQQNLR